MNFSTKLKGIAIASSAALAVFASATASAATVTPGVGQYTFSGPATLTSSIPFLPDLSCTLSLTGDVQKDGDGGVIVTVTAGDATNGAGCGLVGFEFPWTATVPASQIPADPTQEVGVAFENVVVTPCNVPAGGVTVPAIFGNGDPISQPSFFMFMADVGDCAVAGTINAQTDVNVTQ